MSLGRGLWGRLSLQGCDQASRDIPSFTYLDCEIRAPSQAPAEGGPLWPVRCCVTYVGVEEFSSSAGGEGDTGPNPDWGSSGARGSASKEGKQHLGRKREMALLSFVVGFDGGELPLSIEIGALAADWWDHDEPGGAPARLQAGRRGRCGSARLGCRAPEGSSIQWGSFY